MCSNILFFHNTLKNSSSSLILIYEYSGSMTCSQNEQIMKTVTIFEFITNALWSYHHEEASLYIFMANLMSPKLDFPTISVCPPEYSYTPLYHDLIKAGEHNFTHHHREMFINEIQLL